MELVINTSIALLVSLFFDWRCGLLFPNKGKRLGEGKRLGLYWISNFVLFTVADVLFMMFGKSLGSKEVLAFLPVDLLLATLFAILDLCCYHFKVKAKPKRQD